MMDPKIHLAPEIGTCPVCEPQVREHRFPGPPKAETHPHPGYFSSEHPPLGWYAAQTYAEQLKFAQEQAMRAAQDRTQQTVADALKHLRITDDSGDGR